MRLSSSALILTLAVPGLAYAQTPPPPRPTAAPVAAPAPAPEAAPAVAPAPAPTVEVAAPAPAPAPEAAPAAAPAAPPVTWAFEGLVDAYYMYKLTGDSKSEAPATRQFDTNSNSFTLNYAKLGAQADTEFFALRADVGAGHTAAVINTGASLPASGGTTSPEALAQYGNAFLVQQAFATLKISPQMTLDFGRFVTNAGAEVIESNKNWLYSRSLLFFGIPLLHTGVRLGYQVSPMLKVQASVVNGWNNDPDDNTHKTYGLSLFLTPPDTGINASLNTYFGKEGASSDTTMLVDAVVTKDIDALSIGANLDYFKLGDANWFGLAAMAKYTVSPTFYAAGRVEYIKSKNGYGGLDGSLYEVTALGAYTVNKHYELRAELRYDGSDKDTVFTKGAEAKKFQATGLVAALAYF